MSVRLTMMAAAILPLIGCVNGEQIADDTQQLLLPKQIELDERLSDLEAAHEKELEDLRRRVDELERWRADELDPAVVDLRSSDVELKGIIDDLSDAAPGWILVDTTWTVDGEGLTSTTFVTPSAAVSAAQGYRIAPSAVLTIELDDGDYTAAAPLEIRHPDGAQLELVGNITDPNAVKLVFAGSDGIVVQDGYSLGLLDGVTVQGNGQGTSKSGVTAQSSSFVKLGEAVVVQGFSGFGLRVVERSVISAEGVTIQYNKAVGIYVDGASAVYAKGASITSNIGHGVMAVQGSYAFLESAAVNDNRQIGVYLINGSAASLVYAATNNNDVDGVRSFLGSSVYATFATSNNNGAAGFTADRHSVVNADSTTATGNGTVPYTPSIGAIGNLNSIIVP